MIQLRPYQIAAAVKLEAILRDKRVAYLRGEPRVGKTLTMLSLAQRFKAGGTILVITQKKAIKAIEKDAKALLGDGARFITVTNYAQMHKFKGKSYMMVVVDEAHNIGSFPKQSKRFKDIKGVSAALWLFMSATPSPEGPCQLYHQFALSGKPWGHYKNFYRWADDYVNVYMEYYRGAPVKKYNRGKEAKILADIEPFCVTATQEQAGFETQITERVHYVKMRPRTMRIYDRILKDGIVGGLKNRCILADTGVKQQSKLLQISSGTVITEQHGAMILDRSKVEYIQKTFTKKLAILYVFDAEGKMLREAYGDRAVSTPEEFNERPEAVFIGQVRSSREGVNLSSADDLVFFGVEHSALSRLQGMDRASYLGRTKENRVHYILAEGTLEREVYEVVKGKEGYTSAHFTKYREKTLKPELV